METTVLNVRDLKKAYGDFLAVDGVGFELRRGEIFGLLGPNGAGKTTTLECLEGIRRPDSGRIDVLAIDPARDGRKLRTLIGVQLQSSALPASMRVDESMAFFSAYHGVAPRYDLLDRMGLGDKRSNQYRELSVGQQRRLALALALAHRPRIVFLDEPTAGLDVGSRTELHTVMTELKSEGTSIVLATHDMAEAEKMSDRVAILLKGKIVATGTPRELTATGSGYTKVSVRTEKSVLSPGRVEFPAVTRHSLNEDYATFFSTDPGPTVSAILAYLNQQNDKLIDLRVERPSLEERFLEITHDGGSR
ncbi:MAG: ABC transporter ATP-binding protein [Rudaea sp.]